MSDNEYYSNSNSESEASDNESESLNKKPLFKPSLNIKVNNNIKYNDDSDQDDAEPDNEEHDNEEPENEEPENEEQEIEEPGLEEESDEEEEESDDDDDDDQDGGADDDNSDIEIDEDGEPIEKVKTNKISKPKKTQLIVEDDEEEDDDEYDENYLQKFDNEIIKNYVNDFHPECLHHNYEEIAKLSIVVRNSEGIIVDPLHKTIPYLTKYERARILGQRSKQIETGAKPLVKVPENIVDGYIIAELELSEKKIPFIIRRPIPGGACEYWSLKDLEVIAF
jgi:DNA-directed RNA polymerase subunit K/omega